MVKEFKLTLDDIKKLIKEDKKKAKRKKKKAKKAKKIKANTAAAFDPIKHNPNMRDHVTASRFTNAGVPISNTSASVFPNTGASVLTREVDTLRGELNKVNNRLIGLGDNNKEPEKKHKSTFHSIAERLGDDIQEGKRSFKQHKNGSFTIGDIARPKTPKPVGRPKGSVNKAKIVEIGRHDGIGDFSVSTPLASSEYKSEPKEQPSLSSAGEHKEPLIKNEKPVEVNLFHEEDNVDVAKSEWNDNVDNNDVEDEPRVEEELPDDYEEEETKEEQTTLTKDDLNNMELDEVKKYAKSLGISIKGKRTKQSLINKIFYEPEPRRIMRATKTASKPKK